MHCKMIKLNAVIDCSSVNSCEKCGVLHVARHDNIVIDASNCSKFYQNDFYFTRIESPFGYKQGGKRCCEGGLRIVSNGSGISFYWYFWSRIVLEHTIKNIIFFKSRVKSGRYQEGSIHVCWCDQCFYNRTNIFGISTDSGGPQPPSRLSFLWTRWHQRISIPHHHCYYFGFLFCETQKGTANKVGLKLKEA